MSTPSDHFTFTVGKLDAGMAILLGERAHLIEFPSILLPPGATAGSIVNISVHQNHAEETRRDTEFWQLQEDIAKEFGVDTPATPELKVRNVTQTSVTLEWPPIELATAKLRSLDIYRNGQRLATIPSPMTNTSTKLSGLDIFTDYSFQLILRTTAGTYPSNIIRTKTHNMANTSGISVCFGNVQDTLMLENAKQSLRDMKARWSDKIQIDTTHFVCTTPAATPTGAQAAGNLANAPGVEYQRALQLSIPIVQPQWILACHAEKKMIPIAAYYLGATPATPMASAPFSRPQSMSQASLPRSPTSPAPNPNKPPASNRASMPPPSRGTTSPQGSSGNFVNQPASSEVTPRPSTTFGPTPEEPEGQSDDNTEEANLKVEKRQSMGPESMKHKSKAGSMNRDFKFPTPTTNQEFKSQQQQLPESEGGGSADLSRKAQPAVIAPSSIEVPPPPPVEKERSSASLEEAEDDLGDTVDIPL